MAKLVITQEAKNDIEQIVEGIIEYTHFVESGVRLYNDLYEKIHLIGFMPEGAGRLRKDGFREAFCRGYRIIYEIANDVVYIRTILHSRMLYPRPTTV